MVCNFFPFLTVLCSLVCWTLFFLVRILFLHTAFRYLSGMWWLEFSKIPSEYKTAASSRAHRAGTWNLRSFPPSCSVTISFTSLQKLMVCNFFPFLTVLCSLVCWTLFFLLRILFLHTAFRYLRGYLLFVQGSVALRWSISSVTNVFLIATCSSSLQATLELLSATSTTLALSNPFTSIPMSSSSVSICTEIVSMTR